MPSKLELTPESNQAEKCAWLRSKSFHALENAFANYEALDILNLSRKDLIDICGVAEGIRLYNLIHPDHERIKFIFNGEVHVPVNI